ncbi:hypothetical protein WJX73_000347 [Symbiochloris irregularis]|uniref:PUM-HD domain-containing protein n=1 Tax=Symbiochloris irregularis TaxID=706552 RepID=A0AAW1NPA3_9CHLO
MPAIYIECACALELQVNKEAQTPKRARLQLLQGTVPKWEKLRRHDTDDSEKAALISSVLEEAKGQLSQLTSSHTGARVIQACAKHGSQEDRNALLEEILPNLLDLAKSPYGHFTVSKLIELLPKANLPGVLKTFQGHIGFLLRHPCGASVVNVLYDRCDTAQRDRMAAELYGKEYTVLTQEAAPGSLEEALSGLAPPQRRAVLQRLHLHLHPIMEKAMVDPHLTHRLLAEYLRESSGGAVADAVEMLAGPALLRMVHTRHGAHVGCAVLAYGSPKDRKKAVKALKGHVKTMATDDWAHIVLMAALSHTDDTALLLKAIVPELLANAEELCQHKCGVRIFLNLLDPLSGRHLPPHVVNLLKLPAKTLPAKRTAEAADAEVAHPPADSEAQILGASKKSTDVRRTEILGSGDGSLAHALTSACREHAHAWLRQPVTSGLVAEVARRGAGGLLPEGDAASGVGAVHEAIIADAALPREQGGDAPAATTGKAASTTGLQPAHLLEDWHGSRAMRTLIKHAKDGGPSGAAAQSLTEALWARAMEPRIKDWLQSAHARKVLLAVKDVLAPSSKGYSALAQLDTTSK